MCIKLCLTSAVALMVSMLGVAAHAQDGIAKPSVSIELNTVKPGESGCKLSFLVLNTHGAAIEKAVYETVLFDSAGQVDRLTLFDFGTLPPDRPRVRQFSISGMDCNTLGQVLINGAHTCEAPDLDDKACEAGLTLTTRTAIEVIG